MFTFELTTDANLVRTVMTNPAVFDGISDDTASASEFHPDMHLQYVLARDADDVLGIFIVRAFNEIWAEVHTCLLGHCRGGRALAVYKAGLEWLWRHSRFQCVTGLIRPENRGALWIAKAAGLKIVGTLTSSILKNDQFADQVLLSINRPLHLQ